MAVRSELMEYWRPRNGGEQQLVDQLAQWQVLLWQWQEALSTWAACATCAPRRAKKGTPHETMRLSEAAALERATKKVDLLQRLCLRTLKALQDQWRPRPTVDVRHGEQVNLGSFRISVDSLGLHPDSGDGLP